MKTAIARMAAWGCAAGVIATVGACGTTLKGRAITGSAGIVTVVPDDGARDERPGIEGVEVTIRTAGGGIIGTTTSEPDGRFTLKTTNDLARGRVEVIAEREGYPRQRGTVTFPGSRHLLLVILPERGGGDEVGEGSGAEEIGGAGGNGGGAGEGR